MSKTEALTVLTSSKESKFTKDRIIEPGLDPRRLADQSATQDPYAFPIYKIGSYRSAPPQFWVMLLFFYLSFFYAITKLVLFLQSDKSELEVQKGAEEHRDLVISTVFVVGSFVWTLYTCTCCAVYFVHFCKTEELTAMMVKWQIVEGELISESKAMQACGESVESFINRQKKGLLCFLVGMPLSFIFLATGTTYYKQFPMNMYSTFSKDFIESREWVEPMCLIISWVQVGFFLICESQTELVSIAFVRSIFACLKILNKPATHFYSEQYRDKFNSESTSKTITPTLRTKTELLEIFNDSVFRFESLRSLMDDFNAVFAWPLFTRKAFTMAKVCCYVYLLLRRPANTGFPATIVFFYAAVAIFAKYGVILSTMGAVRVESKKFAREWRNVLMVISPNERLEHEERKLNRCNSFGFKMGNFYTVTSQTLLTFCSVVLTYLIILLQL